MKEINATMYYSRKTALFQSQRRHFVAIGMQKWLLFTGRHFWNRKCRKKTWWQQEFAVFKCEATANSVTGHVCVNSNKRTFQKKGKRRAGYEKRNMCDIMSAEETNAAAKQTYSFLAPLTNEQPCEAGRWSAIARVREWTGENTFL